MTHIGKGAEIGTRSQGGRQGQTCYDKSDVISLLILPMVGYGHFNYGCLDCHTMVGKGDI